MPIVTYPKGSSLQISRYFKAKEFDCRCDHCDETKIDSLLVTMLDLMRERAMLPIRVNSGYRCAWYQESLRKRGYETAKGISTHERGMAADIEMGGISGEAIERHAKMAGFKAIGVGRLWCHVDTRMDKVRSWSYKS